LRATTKISHAPRNFEITAGSDCGARPAVRSGRADRSRSVQARIAFSYGVGCSGSSFSERRPNCDCNCRRKMTQAVNFRQRLARSTVCNVAASVPTAIRTIALPITISITGDPPGCAGAIGTSKHGEAVSTVIDTTTALVFPPSPRSPAPPD
jgi:hypothetical protein